MKTIALIGLPNCGKSALFNAMTGARQRVANFPGITVEKKKGEYLFENENFNVLDLPGIYSMDTHTLDEKVTRDFILGKAEQVDCFLFVVDATNFEKSLYLALQLKEFGIKAIFALNLFDEATKRGMKIDIKKLEKELGFTIVPTVAVDKQGIEEVKKQIHLHCHEQKKSERKEFKVSEIQSFEYVKKKMQEVKVLAEICVQSKLKPDTFTQKIDRIVLHPLLGMVILFAVLLFTFELLFNWATPFADAIEAGLGLITDFISAHSSPGLFQSFMNDGVIGGVGAVVVFVPHILFLFLLILFLEDIGYMGRVAFMMDYLMRRIGLPGKAVVPLLSSHACAIPGIMAARIIENPAQRLLTMMISPLMSCSARLPVYTVVIAAIAPVGLKWMGFSVAAWIMMALYLFGMLVAVAVAMLMKKVNKTQSVNYLLMELPPYRVPRLKNLWLGAWSKAKAFLTRAGSIIFILSITIWFLVTFPRPPIGATEPDINYSAAAVLGKGIQPIFAPLGYDWRITTALIPSFAAREVMVTSLATVLSVEGNDDESISLGLSEKIATEFSLATLLSLLVWFVISPQCISTVGILRRETGGIKYPAIFMGYTLVLAYGLALLTYLLFRS